MTAPDGKRVFWEAYTGAHPDPGEFTAYDKLRPDTVRALGEGVRVLFEECGPAGLSRLLRGVVGADAVAVAAGVLGAAGIGYAAHRARKAVREVRALLNAIDDVTGAKRDG